LVFASPERGQCPDAYQIIYAPPKQPYFTRWVDNFSWSIHWVALPEMPEKNAPASLLEKHRAGQRKDLPAGVRR
jgi:hypothetical protein